MFPDLSSLDNNPSLRKATFAGGCFWCMEPPFETLDGVEAVISGYANGHVENPTYEEVTTGTTGHYEAVQVYYDPTKTSFDDLLNAFWKAHDPTDGGGQFGDRGPQYKPAAFYRTEEERELAEASKQALEDSKKFSQPIATEIIPFESFYPAEEYHQQYYLKNSLRYNLYKEGSGRGRFLKEAWGEE